MKPNSTNKLAAGEIIFTEGEKNIGLNMVLKGKTMLYNRGFAVVMGAGTLLGAETLEGEACSCSCRTEEEAAVYVYPADNEESMHSLFGMNSDYNSVVVYNGARLISELTKQVQALRGCAYDVYDEITTDYEMYINEAHRTGCKAGLMTEIQSMKMCETDVSDMDDELTLYREYLRIPFESFKAFFGLSIPVTVKTIKSMTAVQRRLMVACAELSDYIAEGCLVLAASRDYGLFRNLVLLGSEMKTKNPNEDTSEIDGAIERCRQLLQNVGELLDYTPGKSWSIDKAMVEELTSSYLAGCAQLDDSGSDKAVDADVAAEITSLKDSFTQIVRYADYSDAEAEEFKRLLAAFAAAPDKTASDDNMRKLRKSITEHFYGLYEAAFTTYVRGLRPPKAAELFLDYGYVSEKLISETHLASLLSLKPTQQYTPCRVYTMKEWLAAVWKGEKEPSRNDKGQDYAEALREMKRVGSINEAREKELLSNAEEKVRYEIKNVLTPVSRVVNGQLLSFVPVLHDDMFFGDVVKSYNSSAKINCLVSELVSIDFSVFSREALYTNPALGIDREYIQKQVYPVFIICPTVGQNVIMWQEITGRKRDSEGRFFAPAFSDGILRDMLIKSFGQFRWDLCKTIQGVNWNNIQNKSLTSEYADYIQFYKKNHELSEERKEKIKLQIQRKRNNLREVFTLDYIAWIRNESEGAVRLNKVARDILAMYCPFEAHIRVPMLKQPIYEEGFARFNRERNKKLHELGLRYRALETKGVTLPEELSETLRFYKDL